MIPKTMKHARGMAKTLQDVLHHEFGAMDKVPLGVAQAALAAACSRANWNELAATIDEPRRWNPARGGAVITAAGVIGGAAAFAALAERMAPKLKVDRDTVPALGLFVGAGAREKGHREWVDSFLRLLRHPGFAEFTRDLALKASREGWVEDNMAGLDMHTSDGRALWEPYVRKHVEALAADAGHLAWPSVAFMALVEMAAGLTAQQGEMSEEFKRDNWKMVEWFETIAGFYDEEDAGGLGAFLWALPLWERDHLLRGVQHFVATAIVYAVSGEDGGHDIPIDEMGSLPAEALRPTPARGRSDTDAMNSGYDLGSRWSPVEPGLSAVAFSRGVQALYGTLAWLRADGGDDRLVELGAGPDPLCVDTMASVRIGYRQESGRLVVDVREAGDMREIDAETLAAALAMEILQGRCQLGRGRPPLDVVITAGDDDYWMAEILEEALLTYAEVTAGETDVPEIDLVLDGLEAA